MTQIFTRPEALYDEFTRKGGAAPKDTHYCPGCGHGTVHKLIAEAVDDLGVRDRTILISPVGCSVFAYYYFNTGNIQAAHGRAPAVATGVKRARPDSIVLSYQGDGDLAAIGLNEVLQAANRGELITVIFINNAIYGMTGGQMAPTTLIGQRTTTTPSGRAVDNEGYPLGMCELVSVLRAPVYVERVALASPKLTMKARKAIRRALQCQVEGLGFSFVEVLSQCPTGWKLTPEESLRWIETQLMPVFPLKVFKDVTKDAVPRPVGHARPTEESVREAVFPAALADAATAVVDGATGLRTSTNGGPDTEAGARNPVDTMRLKVAGFGGQGVLFLGELLVEAGMEEGHRVSWLPSYGPEMRGGTAHCHVTLSAEPIGSPIVERATHLIAMNGPSLERFAAEVEPGGTILYNASLIEQPPQRDDVELVPVRATELASDLGSIKVANIIMLGALLRHVGAPRPESVQAILARVRKPQLAELNRKALALGLGEDLG